jgi:integrase
VLREARIGADPIAEKREACKVSTVRELAERWEDRPQNTNPAVHVERDRERSRETFLRESDIRALGDALAEVEGESALNWLQCQSIRLLALTGARRSEVLGLEREWIDWERGVAWLPDSKTGGKPLRLGPDALDVLRGIPKRGK